MKKSVKLPLFVVGVFRLCCFLLLLGAVVSCVANKGSEEGKAGLYSPNQVLRVDFALNAEKKAVYSVFYKDSVVLEESLLGVVREDGDFTTALELESVSGVEVISDKYKMLHGKRINCSYTANQQVYHLKNKDGKEMDVIFRVSDDGVAFRYHFPTSTEEMVKITEEKTTFNFKDEAKAWLQPMSVAKTGWESTNPSYEEHYIQEMKVGTASPTAAGWVYPALFKSGGAWILITEADLDRSYCGTRLAQNSEGGEYRVAFPDPREVMPGGELNPVSALPWSSPWRVITVGNLATIVESTLGTDLAEPAADMDFSFVDPGVASWSWALLKDNSITYDIQKRFIDYAADMNWEYCLVDVNWDTTIGYDRIKELADYAANKNVGLILWYNSAGSWNTAPYHPRDKMLTHESRSSEFARLKEMGIKGVKVDFFGGDGQSVIAYYHEIFKDAAENGIMVNCHGSTLPRGWHRTYPNLLTMEAIKGFEFITFFQENADVAANHCAMLPFSRNAFDPMDFTPMVFTDIPDINRKTTNGFELALPYLFLSGVQHIAETPEGVATVPQYVKEFLKEIPVAWDDSKYIDGYPGKLAVIARKKGDTWYVAGINGENQPKSLKLDLSFLDRNRKGQLITDGAEKFSFEQKDIQLSGSPLEVELKPNGGFVMKF